MNRLSRWIPVIILVQLAILVGIRSSCVALEVRVAVPKHPSAAPLYVAQKQGYFDQIAITVHQVEASDSEAAISMLEQGRVQMAVSRYVPIILRAAGGTRLTIVSNLEETQNAAPDTLVLLARKNHPVVSVKHLEGRQVAVGEKELFGWVALMETFRRHSTATEKIRFRLMNPEKLLQAFRRKFISAILVSEPYATMISSRQRVTILAYPYIEMQRHMPLTGLVGMSDWKQLHPHSATRVRRALAKAIVWLTKDKRNAWKVMQEWLKIDKAVSEKMVLNRWSMKIEAKYLQRIADGMQRWKMLEGPFTTLKLLDQQDIRASSMKQLPQAKGAAEAQNAASKP